MRVLIIGGGIGGLTLAHGLLKAGIDVQVFEQQVSLLPPITLGDDSTDFSQTERADNLAGYGLHIDRNGRQALRSCLPLSNWTRLQTQLTSAGTQTFFRDTQLRVLAKKDDAELSCKSAHEVERSGVGRLDLWDTLLDGLGNETSGIIHWGRTFVRYEKLEDGRVRAHFSDNTHEDGHLLVGADGPKSVVRQQLLPGLERLDLGVSAIAGRYTLDEKKIHNFPPEMTNGALNNIVPSGKGWMFTSAWKSRSSGSQEASPAERYIVWAYVIPTKDVLEEVDTKTSSELEHYTLQCMKTWSPVLQELVKGTDSSATKCLSLRSMPILDSWEASNVTLLGDAIHNMTPMAGMGANTALRDAEVLTNCLIDVMARRLSLVDAIEAYTEEMRSYANKAIQLSTQNAINACNGGTPQRFMFRSFLRVANMFPIITRATFG